MLSLNDILARHCRLLCLDAASDWVHVGWLEAGKAPVWDKRQEGAGTGLFRGLEALGADPTSADAFLFCDGPGSILGIRTAAMAVRAWQVEAVRPAYAYSSLQVASVGSGDPSLTLIADARRERWHCLAPGRPLERREVAALGGPLATPAGFRSWAPLPAAVATVAYDPAATFAKAPDLPFFTLAADPDAFLHEEPSYATWTPQVHRSP